MEKSVLKTLIYSDLFDYPLALSEIHRWLIGKKITVEQVEKVVQRLVKKRKIYYKDGFYFLPRRKELVSLRMEREKVSVAFTKTAEWIANFFKLIPGILLVGISGSVAVRNATSESDIDLFVITRKNRLWISRFLLVLLLEFFGKRRRRADSEQEGKGKICLNLMVTEDSILQKKSIYVAHEILQMKVLWEKEGMYQRFLEANEWVHTFLPNWIGYASAEKSHLVKRTSLNPPESSLLNSIENILGVLQKRYMGKPLGQEKITDCALFFHPHDIGPQTIAKFEKRTKLLKGKA